MFKLPFTALIGAIVLSAAVVPSAGAAPLDDSKPLKIGIIGTGNIGGALAKHWAKAGHEIVIASRHPEQLKDLAKSLGPKVRAGTPKEAATFGDVVLISIPYAATAQLGRDLRSELEGKVVLDTGNPYPNRDGPMAVDARKRGTGATSAEFLPGTRLVRAFNAIKWTDLTNEGNHPGEKYAIPLAGDDAEALRVAQRLVRDAGFDPVVVGGLASAKLFDVDTPVYVKLLTVAETRKALNLSK
ncbi:MAG: NADPH-dependent F420 reductase [Gammaproteobacteria bacterium]